MVYFYHLTILFLQRIFYGELSSEYYFGLKKFKKRYPNTSIQYKACFKTEVILHFDRIFNRKPDLPVYMTTDTIQFNGNTYGLTYKQICLQNGKPESANYEWIGDKLVKVICFRHEMLERSVKINYFLTDGRFFLGEFQFHTVTENLLGSVRNILQTRYHCRISDSGSTFYIEDKNDSLICFTYSGFALTVQYYFPQLKEIDAHLRKTISKTSFKQEEQENEGKFLTEML